MDHNDTYEVHGTVTGRDGDPLRHARVVVWWQQIRERAELAAGETSENGRYNLSYQIPGNAPQPVLLVVEAFSDFLDESLLSPLTQAQPDLAIDLNSEPPDQSEWATLARSLEPLLNGVTLAELVENSTHQDISFLARELATDTETIMRVAVCARLESAFDIPGPAFYAFLRRQVLADLPSQLLDASHSFTLIVPLVQSIGSMIFRLSPEVQTQALTSAVALDLIGPQYTSRIPQLVSQLQALRSADLLNRPYLAGNTTLAQLLDVAGLPRDKHQSFARALAADDPSIRGFWPALGDGQHGMTAAEASAIERTLSVGALVDNHVPLVQHLIQGLSSGTYQALSDLARLSRQDWVQLVSQTGPPPGTDTAGTVTPAQVFAGAVHNRVTRAYPTAALSSRIATGTFVPPPHQQPLVQFFQNNPDLELVKDDIPAYLASAGDGAFAGINPDDQAAVVAHARSFQRVLHVAPDPDVTQTLLGLGIKSATQIATLGQQQFLAKATAAGLTDHEANQAFQTAAQRHAHVMSLYMQHNRDAIGIWPKAVGQTADLNQPMQQALSRDPSLATLFGSQDYCATDDCTSILSPAACLCDLLLWLRNHQQGPQTALDVLDSRRPDIRHLLLNCPNTDTELPYIDLVNELLADKISPPIDPATASYVQTAPINATTYHYIVTAVNAVGESPPSPEVSASSPAAPRSLSATPGDTQVTLSWDPVRGADSYNIYWSTTAGVSTADGGKITRATSPYTQMPLTNGTTYHYIVTAVNATGESPPSPEISVTAGAPAAPSGLSATPGDAQVTLSWERDPVRGADSYNIYWSTTAGVTTASDTHLKTNGTFWPLPLTNGTTYYFIVTAVNDTGESPPSPEVFATPLPPELPAAPSRPFADPSITREGTFMMLVSWDPVSGADSYNIYWSTTAGVTTANRSKITKAASPYTQMPLTNGTTYYYIVTAVNATGESPPSSEIYATAGAPAAPSSLSATPGDAQVSLSWDRDPALGADSYKIYWSTTQPVTTANRSKITPAIRASRQQNYQQRDLTNGTTYYYIVTGVNATGEGPTSRQVSATAGAPPAPRLLSATPGDGEVDLSWDPVPGADSYNIYWSTTQPVTTANRSEITNATSPYTQTVPLVTNFISYFYIITAVNSFGEGLPSPETAAWLYPPPPPPPPPPPDAPSGLSATPGDAQVTLSWEPVPGTDSYNIYWSTTAGVSIAPGNKITRASSPYTQMPLTNGTTYHYIVTAVNAGGESRPSLEVFATPVPPELPAAPSGLSATPGDAQVILSWDKVPGATRYNLYWSTTGDVSIANGSKIAVATSPYMQAPLINGTRYHYIVTAVNAADESRPSPEISTTPMAALAPSAPPAAPSGQSATAGNGQITLHWAPVPGATSYNIYGCTTSGVTTARGYRITGAWNPAWKQTAADKTAADLSAAPEYFDQGAYVTLSGASYPFTLPYSASLDELRTYLQHLKLPLWQLRQALLPLKLRQALLPLSGASISQQAAVAAERFGMTPRGQDLIARTDSVPAPVAWNTPDPLTHLAQVGAFLSAASITYESLLELLEVAWVQDGLNVAIQGADDTCMTSKQSLTYMTSKHSPAPLGAPDSLGFLDRAHRFLRLWLATGYKMWELDLLLGAAAVGNGRLDEQALAALLCFRQLQDATGLAVDHLLAFYQDIDIATHRDPDGTTTASLYARIFLNTAVTSVAPDPDLAALATGGTLADHDLNKHLAGIQAALGVSAADAATLFRLTDNRLTLANLSLIYRVTTLARAAKLPVSDLLALARLLNPACTLTSPVDDSQTSITVTSDTGFPAPSFPVAIGPEILLVTAAGGTRNTTWTVERGQQGTTPAAAEAGTVVAGTDGDVNRAALAPLFASPAATLSFLAQATVIQQASLDLDALTYLLTPPDAAGGWATTTTQMTQAAIATALGAVRQRAASLLSARTTLTSSIDARQTSITVASDTGFTPSSFPVAIGPEILLVTAAGGTGNTTWTVERGQQGTTAAPAGEGTAVTPTARTTLTSPIDARQTSITVTSNAGFPAPSFPVAIGPEILLVTAAGGTGNTTWTVERGQQGTTAAPAGEGTAVTPTARTTLTSSIDARQTSITVTSDTGFTSSSFPVAIGPEILLVTAAGGTGNTTWTVERGQQGTTAAPAAAGTPVTPTGGVAGATIAAVAANARTASTSGLANDVSALILQQLRVPGTGMTLLAVLTDPAFIASGSAITQASFPSQFLAIQLFDKAAVLVRGLRLVASDLTWLLANAAVYGGLDFTQLPVTSGRAAVSLPPLLTTLLVIKLARLWTAAPPSSPVQTLYDVISGVSNPTAPLTEEQARRALATITGWPPPDVDAFAKALGLDFPGDYQQPTAYDALRTLEAMAATAGATGPQIVDWGAVPPDEPAAKGIAAGALGVLKAQQPSNDAWLTLSPTLMNPIRENRSAALQAYLIAQRDSSGALIYADAKGLFDYFLIDVQMSSCQVTSRVVQAYVAVQTFVERCLMNLEAPEVVVDMAQHDTWDQWKWMSRYRIWQANREVFLYPENWLIESQRPNRTEIYQKLEQEVHQGQLTAGYLETVVLNYLDRLDGLAHLQVTGTCQDPGDPGGNIYVVARTPADPPVFYLRSFADGAWTGWTQIPLNINAYHAVPALYRGRVCLFWLDVKVSNEPQQVMPPAKVSDTPPSQTADRYVSLGINFSTLRNGSWAPAQAATGKLFDKPFYNPALVSDATTVAGLYTLKIRPKQGYGARLFIDVFRLGDFKADPTSRITDVDESVAVHLGQAVFDGRFSDLELRDLAVPAGTLVKGPPAKAPSAVHLLAHAKEAYGPAAQALLPLPDDQADRDVSRRYGLILQAGALTPAPDYASQSVFWLNFFPSAEHQVHSGVVLGAAPNPWRIVGPGTDTDFDPASYFFFADNRRCYWVETQKLYWVGSDWSPKKPSDPNSVYKVVYIFHPFYYPFTGLFWNQLAGGGFAQLYDPDLQQAPDSIDPSSDLFSFQSGYLASERAQWDLASVSTTLASPISSALQTDITVTNNIWVPLPAFWVRIGTEILKVTGAKQVPGVKGATWTVVRGQGNPWSNPSGQTSPAKAPGGTAVTAVTPVPADDWANFQDRQFLDFSYAASFSAYNWELFYHIPLYTAQLLSQNQQFEDAQTWLKYIFNPTHKGSDPIPQRFWIPKPLHNLTSAGILQQQINNLLAAVNQGDPASVSTINAWRKNPFNPFVLADLRPVAYMKAAVMSYLDNLIAWADNLFSTESREALGEATLLYVIASEILGPQPAAITPPQHADESFDQLEASLDAFANAFVEIENVIGGTGGSVGSAGSTGTGIPVPTFYFKIPSNSRLLGYWTTVADRLYKLRHCQNIAGAPLQLALFDAPIDPGLLIAARAAGVDLSSVLSDVAVALPNYRFTALYPQALDFVNAVRAYGSSLQAALEKSDAGALVLLQQTARRQLLRDGSQILDWQVQQAQADLEALNEALNLAQQKYDANNSQPLANADEISAVKLKGAALDLKISSAMLAAGAAVAAAFPKATAGGAGFGGSPVVAETFGGEQISAMLEKGATSAATLADSLQIGADIATTIGAWNQRREDWDEAAEEARIQIAETQAQIEAATFAVQIAQQNKTVYQERIDNIQKQIDFLNSKFTSDSLYDWMTGMLSATYFQSYQLAYQMCKQLERCYQFELGIQDSSFIQFGYWDSLHKGLLAGETLNRDLRRMQAAYLQQNARRYELSRYVSLGQLDLNALRQLLVTGQCDFSLPESLFDNDYPGHYNRRLTRVSLTVLYPSPGKFDNVKATLTMVTNQVRISTDKSAGYAENPAGSDKRFLYNYAAVPQKIAMSNAQDDPGLFITAIDGNITDQRYVPFENAGAISSWHLETPQINNEVDVSTVTDVVLHLYYTALDGGTDFQAAVQKNNADHAPTSGIKVFSAQNDFPARAPTTANPYPPTPWQAFLATVAAPANQVLTLSISPSKFPPWTRGKTLSVTSLTVLAVGRAPGNFVLAPQAPLPTDAVVMKPVEGVPWPNVCAPTITMPDGTPPGTWSFQLRQEGVPDFRSLTENEIGDVTLLVSYQVS